MIRCLKAMKLLHKVKKEFKLFQAFYALPVLKCTKNTEVLATINLKELYLLLDHKLGIFQKRPTVAKLGRAWLLEKIGATLGKNLDNVEEIFHWNFTHEGKKVNVLYCFEELAVLINTLDLREKECRGIIERHDRAQVVSTWSQIGRALKRESTTQLTETPAKIRNIIDKLSPKEYI